MAKNGKNRIKLSQIDVTRVRTILLQGNIFCCGLNCGDMYEDIMEQARTAGVTLANAKSFVLAFLYKIIGRHTLKAA